MFYNQVCKFSRFINVILFFCNHSYSLPAKYIDPLTCIPYHNSHCFRMIREAYYQQLEGRGDRNNQHLDEWLRWYSKNKEKVKKNVKQVKIPPQDS